MHFFYHRRYATVASSRGTREPGTMNATNRYSKAALVLAAGALIISAANAGGPAIANALGANSDTVDGFDAVKSSTPLKQRKGKLVATSPKNGRLPDNIIAKAPNAAKLAGKPLSYFLSSATAAAIYESAAHAAATYESAAHASATYETASHASATYQTKAAAASAPDQIIVIRAFTPTLPTDHAGTFPMPFTTANAGTLEVSLPVKLRVNCASTSVALAWLAVDGAAVPSSAQAFEANTTALVDFHLTGITAAPVSAGAHQLVVRFGCQTGTWGDNAFHAPYNAFVTVFGSGTLVAPQRAIRPDATGGTVTRSPR
jgi:hypothetical protein